jgi:hypothetical protein
MEQSIYYILQAAFILFAGFLLAYILWIVWQVILWVRDEIAIWKMNRGKK